MQTQQISETPQSKGIGLNLPASGRGAMHLGVRWEAKRSTALKWTREPVRFFPHRSANSQSGGSEPPQPKTSDGCGENLMKLSAIFLGLILVRILFVVC